MCLAVLSADGVDRRRSQRFSWPSWRFGVAGRRPTDRRRRPLTRLVTPPRTCRRPCPPDRAPARADSTAWCGIRSSSVIGVYAATGQFTARPPAPRRAANETARSNVLASQHQHRGADHQVGPDATTRRKWSSIAAAGKRIYVGGRLQTSVSGPGLPNENRAARRSPSTRRTGRGAPPRVRARENQQPGPGHGRQRQHPLPRRVLHDLRWPAVPRLAAVDATTGALLTWAPTSDHEVVSMAATRQAAA